MTLPSMMAMPVPCRHLPALGRTCRDAVEPPRSLSGARNCPAATAVSPVSHHYRWTNPALPRVKPWYTPHDLAPCRRYIGSVPDILAASLNEGELLRNRVIPSIVPMTSGVFPTLRSPCLASAFR